MKGHTAPLVALIVLCGCRQPVPRVPAPARTQPARSGVTGPWRADGRLRIDAPGSTVSCRALLRHEAGRLDVLLLADGGVTLARLRLDETGPAIVHDPGDLGARLQPIAHLFDQGYRPRSDSPIWDRGRAIAAEGALRRCYGGDPLLLRRVDGLPWPLALADYRLHDNRLVPFALTAEGPWTATIAFHCQRFERLDAAPR